MKEFAAAEWDRAGRALESARQLAETDPDSAASRAYYAAFHALTALFALRGEAFSKHSGVRAALHRDLIQTGVLAQELGRDYDFLLELRETGDYGGVTPVHADDARLAVQRVARLLAAVAPVYTALLAGPTGS
ncbi:MAG: HEPN domain-containing protein [Planctomycetota bacterium]|nr:HEPN domain-containing protein [Planctomycetota bacterium]